MSDFSPYGVTQNPDAARVTADALVGERNPMTTANSVVGGPATFSTAPYKPPRSQRPKDQPPIGSRGCIGRGGTCTVGAMVGTNTCVFHRPGGPRGGVSHQPPDVA